MSLPTPWGAYNAGHPNNTTSSLYDFTGNGRNATITGTAPTFTKGSGNGASASIPYMTGTSSTIVTWPENSIPPTTFTILSMTRYTTGPFQRILQANGLDFIIGHWMGFVGLEYHQKWMTQFWANSPNVSSTTNWLIMCGTTGGTTPNNILVNGVGNGGSTGGFTGAQLTINTGFAGGQASNFAFQQVLIWNSVLTAEQMKTISDLVTNYLSTGIIIYPWTGSPAFGISVGTAPTITSITNTANSFNVFFTPGTGSDPAPSTYYYSLNGGASYTDASSTTSPILIPGIITGTIYNVALIAKNTAGNTVASNVIVANIPYPCFLQGSKILYLDPESDTEYYIAVEKLKRGDLIKTSMDGYKAISFIGRATLENPANDPDPKNRLYVFKKQDIKGMTEDLCLTGEHCILRLDITESHLDRIREHMGRVYITDDRFRCPACLDERAVPYSGKGPATIWHFALEHDDAYWNYGVYANGLLVESCSIEHLVNRSKMMLV